MLPSNCEPACVKSFQAYSKACLLFSDVLLSFLLLIWLRISWLETSEVWTEAAVGRDTSGHTIKRQMLFVMIWASGNKMEEQRNSNIEYAKPRAEGDAVIDDGQGLLKIQMRTVCFLSNADKPRAMFCSPPHWIFIFLLNEGKVWVFWAQVSAQVMQAYTTSLIWMRLWISDSELFKCWG